METLGEFVSRIMDERRLNARDVERRSGHQITDGYVTDITKGKQTNLTAKRIVALAKGLGINPHDIFSVIIGVPIKESPDPWPSHLLSKAIDQIINDARLTDNVKAMLKMDANQLEAAKRTLEKITPAKPK